MIIAAILVAAGAGSRFGAETPKQFLRLAGKPVIRHAAESLARKVDLLQPVGEATPIAAALEGMAFLPVVSGGATRQASVRAGLEALVPHVPDIVLVHDAARPVIPCGTIQALLKALEQAPGAIPAVPVADTLKRGNDGRIIETVSRAGLFRAQTPQAFRFATLLAAHRAPATDTATDDASLLEAAGQQVLLVAGAEDNIKLTYPEDLQRLERAMGGSLVPRVGTGFDVHAFADGRPLVLCGVTVPHTARPCRTFRCRCRHPCAVRCDLWRAGRRRYRAPFPTGRGSMERRRQRALPAARRATHRGAGRPAGQCRHNVDL